MGQSREGALVATSHATSFSIRCSGAEPIDNCCVMISNELHKVNSVNSMMRRVRCRASNDYMRSNKRLCLFRACVNCCGALSSERNQTSWIDEIYGVYDSVLREWMQLTRSEERLNDGTLFHHHQRWWTRWALRSQNLNVNCRDSRGSLLSKPLKQASRCVELNHSHRMTGSTIILFYSITIKPNSNNINKEFINSINNI